ncbi:MAG: aminoglycoside phosphotransferase family protein [Myxococcota bacterium]
MWTQRAAEAGFALIGEPTPLPSTQGEVWSITTAAGRAIVKRGSPAQTRREREGLAAAAAVGSVPTVLAQLDDRTLLLSWHEGSPSSSPGTLQTAGAWLRAMHEAPYVDDDPLSVPDALAQRVASWSARAVDPALVEAAIRLDAAAFEGLSRVRCHRDFTPRNWLWSERALTVIDFGQARPDLALWDLVKLEAELFTEQPALRAPFHAGYGGLTDPQTRQLRQLVRLHGLQTATWGDEHGDPEFSALGRRILRQV